MTRVIIAGGRNFDNYYLVETVMQQLYTVYPEAICIISGGAMGADALGEQFAHSYDLKFVEFKANWDKYGKSAGFIRNVEMAKNADELVAFWDGKSNGTKHMINIALDKGLIVHVYRY